MEAVLSQLNVTFASELMIRTGRILQGLGWQGWTLILCGFAAMVVALLDFVELIHLNTETSLRFILISTGLLLNSIAALESVRKADLQDLANALGASQVELIGSRREFQSHVRESIFDARQFVLHTMLTAERGTFVHPLDKPSDFSSVLFARISRGEINYRRVEIIFHRERLEHVLCRLLLYEGMNYLVRYYEAPPKAIPVLNMMSIDNERFYLGGFYAGDAPIDASNAVCIRNKEAGSLLEAYWHNLWQSAIPLNEGKRINWDELHRIAQSLGVAADEFDNMIEKTRQTIQRRSKRSR